MNAATTELSPCLRLVGTSFWPGAGSPMDHLLGLRRRLLQVAYAPGVCVAVLHRAQWLLHWLEGPPAEAESAWQRMQALPELEAVRLLHRSLGAPALQEPVHVAAVVRGESPQQVANQLAALAGDAAPQREPLDLWHDLAAPAAVAPHASVVLASAQEQDALDLLRHLAQAHRARIVYQRFADSDLARIDSGAAYADFGGPADSPVRMQVLSRRGLDHALVRGGLPPVHTIVLLPGTQEDRAARLVESVRSLLRECGGRCEVRVMGVPSAAFGVTGELLRATGGAVVPDFRTARSQHEELRLLEEVLREAGA